MDLTLVVLGAGGVFVMDEDGGVHCFHPSIRDQLVLNGVIFQRDGRWRIRNCDRDIIATRRMDLACCDFCSSRPVTFDVDCRTFEDSSHNISVGGWAACEPCGLAIERRDKAQLLRRSVNASKAGLILPRETVIEMLTENQRLFWLHFKGIKRIPARPFGH